MNPVSLRLPELVLVEDNADDEMLSVRGISRSHVKCAVTVHRDGQAALEALLDPLAALPTLIVLDYQMPKKNGYEVLCQLRAAPKTHAIPIVIFSSTNNGATMTACFHEGANSCVEKPTDAMAYVSRMEEITRYWLQVNSDGSSCS